MNDDSRFKIESKIDSKLNSIKENIHDIHDMLNEISSNINEINFLECLMKGE